MTESRTSKPECFVLFGEWGKKIYDHIMNAKPLAKPLYTKSDAEEFEREASEAWAEAVKEGILELEVSK